MFAGQCPRQTATDHRVVPVDPHPQRKVEGDVMKLIEGFDSNYRYILSSAARGRMCLMKVALGVGGGIAAYKAAEVVRLLQDRGIRVQVVMTNAAQEFVRPLTFAALSGEKVITDLFASGAETPNIDSAVEHISVAQAIDALVVVPATADLLGKFANGLANDFLTTLFLATTAPVVLAPAMNVNMWENAATQSNLKTLRERGIRIVEPDSGYLACGMMGPGRLAANESIVTAVLEVLGSGQELAGE